MSLRSNFDVELMQDLMVQIGFSAAEISEVMGFVTDLETENLWENVEQWADEIILANPCGEVLSKNLEKVRNLEAVSGIHKYSLELVLLLRCAVLLKAKYEEHHMDLKLYYESMKDLTYKLQECKNVYGVTGIFVGFWYDGFFDMTRFALGRLQFEMTKLWLAEPVVLEGYQIEHGTEAINMHIPSSGPLTAKEANEAFALAKTFFKDKFGDRPFVFVMASWLLDKDLMGLLPDGNLKDFAKRFAVVRTSKYDTFYDGWRVFGAKWEQWEKQPEHLPRSTRLQRAIADYLQQGGKLGDGYGLFVL